MFISETPLLLHVVVGAFTLENKGHSFTQSLTGAVSDTSPCGPGASGLTLSSSLQRAMSESVCFHAIILEA